VPGTDVPVVFASGVLLGNAKRLLELNETGELKKLLAGCVVGRACPMLCELSFAHRAQCCAQGSACACVDRVHVNSPAIAVLPRRRQMGARHAVDAGTSCARGVKAR
jgi:hypothetical protein